MTEPNAAPRLFVDADACPVKEEIYKVAQRYGLQVYVVANSWLMVPQHTRIERVVVEAGPDAADDWIADQVVAGDIVISADMPLAARCLDKAALVISPSGRPFTADNIGSALAGRAIGEHLRSMGADHHGRQTVCPGGSLAVSCGSG
ncbi:MAG: hypothetical protein JWM33_1132 [Caulobacteraceae bacterium]|nr:hypothetical protein [Caulobacteraceae bacterium]